MTKENPHRRTSITIALNESERILIERAARESDLSRGEFMRTYSLISASKLTLQRDAEFARMREVDRDFPPLC